MFAFIEEVKRETLGETYEQVNKFIRREDFDPQPYVNYIENISIFEKKVQAIIIDTFKLKEGVINCLLSGDPHLVNRMLKCDWFFEDALPPKSYEEEIFPNVSFSTRCKIINQLGRNIKNGKHAEELFIYVNKNYGSKYAEYFLSKCSLEFITEYFSMCKPAFEYHDSEKNLINICKRFPEIVITFFQREMVKDGVQGNKIMRYLAKHHPLAVTPMFENHYRDFYYLRFGKKSSKSLHTEFMRLTKKAPVLVLIQRMKVSLIFKRLSHEERITFFKLLVQQNKQNMDYATFNDWFQSSPQMKPFIELIPPGERAGMVETVFFELYNEKFLDHPEAWSLELMEVFPEDYRSRLVEILDKSIEVKAVKDVLRSQCKDRERELSGTYLYLLDFQRAFPALTEIMTLMPTTGRRELLLKEMVRNCIINKDPDGLESIVRYMSIRHKNEDPRIICNVILLNLIPCMKYINANVWNWLEKIATLLMVRHSDSHIFGVVMENYIAYRLKNSLDVKGQVRNVVKLSVLPHPNSFVLVRKMEKYYSRALIMLYYDEMFSGDTAYSPEHIKDKLALSLLMTINDYNCDKKRTRIELENLPPLVEAIDGIVSRVRNWESRLSLASAIKRNMFLRNKYASILLDISLKPKMLKYLIKSHPYCIIENFDRILTYILGTNEDREIEKLFAYRCQMDFLGCVPELVTAIGDRFRNATVSSVKVKALTTCSHIATLEEFMALTAEYVPQHDQFRFDENRPDMYEVQKSVPGLIRHVKPVWKNFDFVVNYLQKDLLRFVLPSFFAICHHTSVSTIVPVLRQQLTKGVDVSVKKVILCCILDLIPKSERFKYCQSLWDSENHSSVREFVFHAILRSWRDDQSEEVFEIVKKCISEADEISINGRLKIKAIPHGFQGDYASALWEFTEKYEGREVAIACRKEIVNHFTETNILLMSEELCHQILAKYLFEPESEILVEKFCVDFILYHPQFLDEKLPFVLGLLNKRGTKPRSLKYFIHRLRDFAKSNPAPVFDVFEGLLTEWPKMYGISDMFTDYLALNYMIGYSTALKMSGRGSESLGPALGKEFRKIINSIPNYECYVEIFNKTLYDFVNHFNFNDALDLMIDNFLGDSFGDVEGIIAIQLIPPNAFNVFQMNAEHPDYKNPFVVELRKKYKGIFGKLLDKNDDVLKTYMNLRMNNALD